MHGDDVAVGVGERERPPERAVERRRHNRTKCPRSEPQLTYMIDIALTMEFAISAGGVR